MRFKAEITTAILCLLALIRISAGYVNNSQGFDEPTHVASGMEWLDKGTYAVDPLHPPLARVAIALPLYLVGLRFPQLERAQESYFDIGNRILYMDGHYWRNLTLARVGILPFLLLGTWAVFYWASRLYGSLAGILAAFCFTTLPGILAFAGLAYTDFPAAVMQFVFILAFASWLEAHSLKSSLQVGLAAALALLAKFTFLIFCPAAALGILLSWALARHKQEGIPARKLLQQVFVSVVFCALLVWAGYRFSFKPVVEGLHLSGSTPQSLPFLPSAVRPLAGRLVARDMRLPAPELVMGVAKAYILTHSEAPLSYIFGPKPGATWYFFPVGLFFKTPLPLLILAGFGVAAGLRPTLGWPARAPLISAAIILAVSVLQNYNAGQRHILVMYPLLAVLTGAGGACLWQTQRKSYRILLMALLVWQAGESLRAGLHPMAYFNELAGNDPSRILVTGCDLDCGQDVARLGIELRKRSVEKVHVALWTSADLTQMALAPKVEILLPDEHATGWIAVSVRTLRTGNILHTSYPPGSLSWLEAYRPAAQVGTTIGLYCIPEREAGRDHNCPD